jgi:hypothetical protein
MLELMKRLNKSEQFVFYKKTILSRLVQRLICSKNAL